MPTIPDAAPDQDNELAPDDELLVDQPEPPHSIADAVRDAPLTAIATAFIAGLVVGRLIL